MVYLTIAAIFLLVAVVLLIRWFILRKQAHAKEQTSSGEQTPQQQAELDTLFQKAKVRLIWGVVCMVLCEVCMLLEKFVGR